jgi:energy-coupling factor transport system substrate-specific component
MATEPKAMPRRRAKRIPLTYVIALVPVAAALNIVGGYINSTLQLPTFLDMIGTAVVAIVLGPWWGALVGAITNIVASFISGPVGLPFAACNVVGALVWGYAHQWGWARKTWSFFVVNIAVAFFVSMTAVPIYVFIFGGATGHFSDLMTAAFLSMTDNLIVSVFSSNILVSLADKLISGYVALAIIEALPSNLTQNLKLPEATGLNRIIIPVVGVIIGVAIGLIYWAVSQ